MLVYIGLHGLTLLQYRTIRCRWRLKAHVVSTNSTLTLVIVSRSWRQRSAPPCWLYTSSACSAQTKSLASNCDIPAVMPISAADSTGRPDNAPHTAVIHKFKFKFITQLECGQMPNVMDALPNTGGALCSTPQSLADAHYWSAVQ